MATWMDGPEYAPLERPAEFVDAPHPALAAPAPTAVDDAPAHRPAFSPPSESIDLAAIVPPQPQVRDPHAPFDVTVAAMTSADAAPGDGQAWTPDQPLGRATAVDVTDFPPPSGTPVTTFPQPGTPTWFAPPPPSAPQAPARVGLRELVGAVTAVGAGFFLLGIFFHPIAPFFFVVGLVTASRIAYRRHQVRMVLGVSAAVIVLVAVIQIVAGADLYSWYDAVGWTAQVLSGLVLASLLVICYQALAHRERPTPL